MSTRAPQGATFSARAFEVRAQRAMDQRVPEQRLPALDTTVRP